MMLVDANLSEYDNSMPPGIHLFFSELQIKQFCNELQKLAQGIVYLFLCHL